MALDWNCWSSPKLYCVLVSSACEDASLHPKILAQTTLTGDCTIKLLFFQDRNALAGRAQKYFISVESLWIG